MKLTSRFFVKIFCVAALFVSVTAESPVIELTHRTFDPTLAKGKTLLEFYAPWCSHCRAFASDYEQIARDLIPKGIQVARVNGHKYRMLSMRFQIRGFPTFFLVDKDKVYIHKGKNRGVEILTEFAKSGKEGKLINAGWKNPVGIYWKAVSRVLGEVERVADLVEEKKLSKRVLVGVGGSAILVLLLSFVLLISMVTKPTVRPKRD